MFVKLTIVAAVTTGAVIAMAAGAPAQQQLCLGSAPTITGAGQINGTDGDDVIVGSHGNDRIRAYVGNDKVCAGGGADRIGGGPGNDEIAGGPGDDDIHSGSGDDVLRGGEDDDAFHCGSGKDVVDGGPGRNTAETSGSEACETVRNAVPAKGHSLKAKLNARQAVPRPRRPARRARGVFTATLSPTGTGATLAWRLAFRRLSSPVRAAHIHRGRPGKRGSVLVRLCRPCRSRTIATSEVRGRSARKALMSGKAYVDVHTKRNPRGEIRGRVKRDRAR